jgi:hypothetical protein
MKVSGVRLFILILSGFVALRCEATVYHSDGSAANVQTLHNAAQNGDKITLPAGIFTWATTVRISKAITLQGQGSGRIIGRSLSSVAVGTGNKTFETQSGLPINIGQVLRVVRRVIQTDAGNDVSGTYMQGIVRSYSRTTLTLNVTEKGGSGTYPAWYISTIPQTTINYTPASGAAFSITPATGNVELSGIKFLAPPPGGSALLLYDGFPAEILIHDCWFKVPPNAIAIDAATNSVVMYQCSFDSPFSAVEAFRIKWENAAGNVSWTTTDTMGNRDRNGNKNYYVEDCDFHYFLNGLDFDSNSRAVVRHCTFDNAGIGTHGADTSPSGTRHWEIYDNTFIFEPTTNGVVLNLNWWFFIRGGTGVITGNVMPDIISQDWGDKGEDTMIVENIRRNAGPYACWTTYPAPHSPGHGHNGVREITDPIRIWNNAPVNQASVSQYEPDECGNGELASDFTQINRDYILGTPRPGYQKYTYPHPLTIH